MTSSTEEWKETKLSLAEYKIEKLPRGDERSHEEFQAEKFQYKRRGYMKPKTDEELKAEALDVLRSKEDKIVNSSFEEL